MRDATTTVVVVALMNLYLLFFVRHGHRRRSVHTVQSIGQSLGLIN